MFRFSLTVCVYLILGISAKPHKPWNELTDGEFQHTVMSMKDGRIEVEPPEDMDKTHYEIDPRMMIWKSMAASGEDKKPSKDDEDLDKLYHPVMADLLNRHKDNLEALPAADIQAEPWQEVTFLTSHQEVEQAEDDIEDWDEVYRQAREELDVYIAPLIAGHNAGREVRVAQPGPDKDEDGLRPSEGRVHLYPEEDMDAMYHEDLFKVTDHREETEAVAPVNLPSQRRYSKPEVDLDHIYHQ